MSGCTMTLTLDDVRNTVRNKRFRVARKAGYEVLDVDEFVDEVGESFAQLLEDNQNLKKQIEALNSAPPVPARTPAWRRRLLRFSHLCLGRLLRCNLPRPAQSR